MSHTRFDAIIFDLGGVLVDWNPRYLFRKIFREEERMEGFLRDICNQEWNEKQDAGRPFAEARRELIAKHPEWKEMIEVYSQRWPEMLGGQIHGTVEILEELKAARWPLFALTNWSAETFPHALERFAFFKHFDGIVVSGAEKMLKPDPQFFRLLLDRYVLKAERSFFIDDVQHNVDGAKAVGLHAVRFLSPENLRTDLKALGVL